MRNGEFFYVVCGLRRRSDARRCRSVVQDRCRSFHDESVRDKDSSAATAYHPSHDHDPPTPKGSAP